MCAHKGASVGGGLRTVAERDRPCMQCTSTLSPPVAPPSGGPPPSLSLPVFRPKRSFIPLPFRSPVFSSPSLPGLFIRLLPRLILLPPFFLYDQRGE